MCIWCKKHNRRRIQASHTQDRCFYGDNEGWTKLETISNKRPDQSYFVAFHDSASTPRSYFKDKPNDCQSNRSFVLTANNTKVPVEGSGTVRFGNMTLKDVAYVPSFSKNLISGIQIMKQGFKQIIEPSGVINIFNKDTLVATGKFDEDTGLLKMNQELPPNSNLVDVQPAVPISRPIDEIEAHSRLGHPGRQLLLNTLESTDGISLSEPRKEECEICKLTKTRKTNIRKQGNIPNEYQTPKARSLLAQ